MQLSVNIKHMIIYSTKNLIVVMYRKYSIKYQLFTH